MRKIPLHSLVIMVGPTQGGKTTLSAKCFSDYEIVSADAIKYEMIGDSSRQDIRPAVFREVYHRIRNKLNLGERVVVDAPNLKAKDRSNVSKLGVNAGIPVFYIVCDRPLEDKLQSVLAIDFVEKQDQFFKDCEKTILQGDGVAEVIDTRTQEFEVVRKLPQGDLQEALISRGFSGVTVAGDIHGMRESLRSAVQWATGRNHFLVFLGDITDYGPKPLECVDEVYDIVMAGRGALVFGNHERKIHKWIDQYKRGDVRVKLSDGNRVTTDAINSLTDAQRERFEARYNSLMASARHHYVINDFLFTHAAGHPDMYHSTDHRLRNRSLESLALFGQLDKDSPWCENGFPNRVYRWVDDIPHGKLVVVGHDIRSTTTPVQQTGKNGGHVIFLDTGCGKGGCLTTADIRFTDDESLRISNFNQH